MASSATATTDEGALLLARCSLRGLTGPFASLNGQVRAWYMDLGNACTHKQTHRSLQVVHPKPVATGYLVRPDGCPHEFVVAANKLLPLKDRAKVRIRPRLDHN